MSGCLTLLLGDGGHGQDTVRPKGTAGHYHDRLGHGSRVRRLDVGPGRRSRTRAVMRPVRRLPLVEQVGQLGIPDHVRDRSIGESVVQVAEYVHTSIAARKAWQRRYVWTVSAAR